jgi:CheY-like chemotaxis protein
MNFVSNKNKVTDVCFCHDRNCVCEEVLTEIVVSPHVQRQYTHRCRIFILCGVLLASGLFITCTLGFVRTQTVRRKARVDREIECIGMRDKISEWGKKMSFEAQTYGFIAMLERNLSLTAHTPFVVSGIISNTITNEHMLLSKELGELPPIFSWCPIVRRESRVVYETYIDGSILDQNITYESAPLRESYAPITSTWSIGYSLFNVRIIKPFGFDIQHWLRSVLPTMSVVRLFDERRLIAHTSYVTTGESKPDDGIHVQVPFIRNLYKDDKLDDEIIGYCSFSLHSDRWSFIFPSNMEVRESDSQNIIKTVSSDYNMHVSTHESFLNLDLGCYYNTRDLFVLLHIYGMVIMPIVITCLIMLHSHFEIRASRVIRLFKKQHREALEVEIAEKKRNEDRTQHTFRMSEKTERYLNHEIKNRILVLGQSCIDQPHVHELLDEITEVLNNKLVLMRLSTNRYEPYLEFVDPLYLIDIRWRRFVAANSSFECLETIGTAAHNKMFRLDKVLFNICLDNMLSNAFKYGNISKPPSLRLRVDSIDKERVCLSLELRNWSGNEHAQLIQMGENKLNEIARAEGQRAHKHFDELSTGEGFPMAYAAASVMGGSIRLQLLPTEVNAIFVLPNIEVVSDVMHDTNKLATPLDLSWLKIAIADDSETFRKMLTKLVEKVTSIKPIVVGRTRQSIDDLPRIIIEQDIDIVLLDFNFAPVHHTKTGIDICRECRDLDIKNGNDPRLIFMISSNDSPEDIARYYAAGADGSLSKKMSLSSLRQVIEDAVRTQQRFTSRWKKCRKSW